MNEDFIFKPGVLTEFRCKSCNKLLCKGMLHHRLSVLEIKCRGCGKLEYFTGHDADIIEKRSILIKQKLLPDTD